LGDRAGGALSIALKGEIRLNTGTVLLSPNDGGETTLTAAEQGGAKLPACRGGGNTRIDGVLFDEFKEVGFLRAGIGGDPGQDPLGERRINQVRLTQTFTRLFEVRGVALFQEADATLGRGELVRGNGARLDGLEGASRQEASKGSPCRHFFTALLDRETGLFREELLLRRGGLKIRKTAAAALAHSVPPRLDWS